MNIPIACLVPHPYSDRGTSRHNPRVVVDLALEDLVEWQAYTDMDHQEAYDRWLFLCSPAFCQPKTVKPFLHAHSSSPSPPSYLLLRCLFLLLLFRCLLLLLLRCLLCLLLRLLRSDLTTPMTLRICLQIIRQNGSLRLLL